ncbi:MAG: hypothetical protein U5J62_00185 [Desulfurivibrio sp.]|nr:hypothetical protein [Desulfurivibrio sp.]
MVAKDYIEQARPLEEQGDYRSALAAYEKAWQRWPDNDRLAEYLANLALTRLQLNAKAAHYARQALRLDEDNDRAALLAAVSLAQMSRPREAKEYFDQAIAGPWPAAEALLSYAAFAEQHSSPRGALALLERHRQLVRGNAGQYAPTGSAVRPARRTGPGAGGVSQSVAVGL